MATASKAQTQTLPKSKNKPVNHQFQRPVFNLSLPTRKLSLGSDTKIMGIVNTTPDSFSNDGCIQNHLNPVDYALKLIDEGADIIDIGGESSRPGAKPVNEKEELFRVIPVIKELTKKTSIPISVDTYKFRIAKEALDAGASIINCIAGANPDEGLLKMVARYKTAIVLMHMQGTPQTMQNNIYYKNIIKDIIKALSDSIENCLEIGIKSDRILIDPGIGFGKTVEHNLTILNYLEEFHKLKKPILIGVSRKSFIGKITNKDVSDRLIGSITSEVISITKGAHILRVHDVKETRDAVLIADQILKKTGT